MRDARASRRSFCEPALDVVIVIPAELERALEASPPLRAYAAKPPSRLAIEAVRVTVKPLSSTAFADVALRPGNTSLPLGVLVCRQQLSTRRRRKNMHLPKHLLGAEWYAVSAAGAKVEKDAKASSPDPTSGGYGY